MKSGKRRSSSKPAPPADAAAPQRRTTFSTEANAMNLDVLARMRENLQARQYSIRADISRSQFAERDERYHSQFLPVEDRHDTEILRRPRTAGTRESAKHRAATAYGSRKVKKKQSRPATVSSRAISQSRATSQRVAHQHRDAHYGTVVDDSQSDGYEYSDYSESSVDSDAGNSTHGYARDHGTANPDTDGSSSSSSPRPHRHHARSTHHALHGQPTRALPSKYKAKIADVKVTSTSVVHKVPTADQSEHSDVHHSQSLSSDASHAQYARSPSRDKAGVYHTRGGRSVSDFGVQADAGIPEHVLALAELLRYQTQIKYTGSRYSLVPSLSNSICKQESRTGSPKRSALMMGQDVTDRPPNLQFPNLADHNLNYSIDSSSVPVVLAKPEEMRMSSLSSSQARGAVHQNPVFEDMRIDPELANIYKIFQQDRYFINLSFDLLYANDAWRAGFNHLKEVIYRDIYEERAATLQEMKLANDLIQGYEETTETLNRENERLTEQLHIAKEEVEKVHGMHGMLDFDLKKIMTEKADLDVQNRKLQLEIDALERQLNDMQVEKVDLGEEIRKLHDDLDQKEQRINKSVEKAREFKDQLDTYTREGQVEKMRSMITAQEEQIAEKTAQLRDKSDAIDKLEKRVAKLTTMNQAMVTEREKFIYRLEVSLMATEDKLGALIRLRARVLRLREDKSRLSTELKETAAKLEKMQEIGKGLKATVKAREAEIKEFKTDYNRMKEEYEKIVADFNYKEARIANLEQNLELYKQELANSQQEMKSKAEMLQSITFNSLDNQQRIANLGVLKDRVEQLEADKVDLTKQITDIKEELAAARKENSDLLTAKERLTSQIAVCQEKISYYEMLYENQKKMLEDTEKQRLDLHNKYLDAQTTIAKLQLDCETSKLKQDNFEAENAKLVKESEALSDEVSYLRKENENLRQDKGTDGDALRKLQQEYDILAAKHTTQTQDVEDKQLRIQELIFQNDRMTKFIEEVKDNYRGENVITLINENLRLKADLDNIMAMGKDKLGKTASLLSENNEMKEMVSKLHINAATKDAHLGRAYHENESLNRRLLLLTKDNKDMRDKLAFLDNKVKSYEYKVETLKLELEKRNRLLAARELEVSKLRAMCVKLTQEHS